MESLIEVQGLGFRGLQLRLQALRVGWSRSLGLLGLGLMGFGVGFQGCRVLVVGSRFQGFT